MNEFVRIAQATPPATTESASAIAESTGPLVVERPLAQQSIVMLKGTDQFVDLRQILDETISFFRIDGDLQMIFADGGMVIIQDFFVGDSVADFLIVGDEEFLSLDDFVSLASVQLADEIQTAAGDTSNLATALGGVQSSGQTFEPTDIGALGDGLNVADLLVGEGPTERNFIVDDFSDGEENTSPEIGTPVDSTLDEQNLPEGTDPNNPVSATASLDVFFGDNAGSDVRLEFDGLPSGLTSDGETLIFNVVTNADGGETLSATKSVSGELVFTVALNVVGAGASLGGQYTFDLFGNLDHVAAGQGDSIPLVFGFNAIDTDGDADGDTFTVNIIDDQPEAGDSELASFDEQALSNGTDPGSSALVASGALNIQWGADDADGAADGATQDAPGGTGNRSVVFSPFTQDPGLTSDGVALTYELSENDTVLTAYKGDGRLDADKVFEVTLFDDDTGSYTFELFGNLDHPAPAVGVDSSSLNLTANYIASDGDGDSVVGSFSVAIIDDQPEAGDAVQRTVQEHDLANGTDPDPGALTKTGDLNIVWGADDADAADDGEFQDSPGGTGNRSVVFAAITDQPTQPTTSGGEALEYVLSQGGTVLTAYSGAGRLEADRVFEVSLSDDGTGSYTFELLGNIDHNPPNSIGQIVAWNLDFAFLAVDGDGDAVLGDFRVTVVDDEPLAGTAEQGTVEESDLPSGTDPDADALVQSGELNVIWGADDADTDDAGGVQDTPGIAGNRSITFAPIADQPTQATTSDTVALEYVLSENDTVLTAYKGAGRLDADKVFEVSLSDDGTGSYTFELFGNIDHTSGQTEAWDLDFTFVASDSDGDIVEGDFRVTVADDAPITGEAELGVVEEEELEGGLDDPYPFPLDGAASQAGAPLTDRFSGSLNIVWGADDNDIADSDLNGLPVQDDAAGADQRSVIFSDAADGLIADPASIVSVLDGNGDSIDLTSLTSRGDALSYVLSGDGTQLTAYAEYGQAGERSVFRVALSDDDSGSYTFILDDVLDHPIQDTTPFDEDALSLSFNYLAEDSDGDRALGSFEVLAIDDGPLFRTDDIHIVDGLALTSFTETAELRIPEVDTSGTIFSEIEVTTPGTIFDVNVSLELQHSFSGDLLVFLVHPDGTEIRLIQDSTARIQPVDGVVSFDDDAANTIGTDNTNIVGTWRPDSTLNLDFFEGRDQLGVWTLQVTDTLNGDTGQLVSWTLDIQTGVSAVVDEDDLSTQRGGGIDDNVDGNNDQATGDNATITNALLDSDSDPTTVFGNLGVLWGADNENSVENGGTSAGIGDRAVTFVEGTGGTIESLEALGLTSSGDALTYSLNATADILTATAGGRVVFTVELFDTDTGSFKFDLQDALDHPAGEAENDVILNFLFVATDSDGDTGTSTFSVAVDDDMLVVGDTVETVTLDEDDIVNPFSFGSEPGDGNADGSTTGLFDFIGPALAQGSFASIADFGADGPGATGGFGFSSDAISQMEALGLQSQGAALTFDVVDAAGASFLIGFVDDGSGSFDSFDDRPVISLELEETGDYILRLHDQLDHVAGNGENTTLSTVSGTLEQINFGAVIEVSDGDGDTVNLSGQLLVRVTDDIPGVDIWVEDYVRIDETYGLHSDNVFDPSTGEFDPDVVELFEDVERPGSDNDLPGPIYASFGVVGFDIVGGADDDPDIDLSLRIDDPNSGLTTTEGKAITLSLEDGLVVGRIDGNGDAVFAVHLAENGDVSIVQFQSLSHPDTTTSDEFISLDGKLSAVLTVTDADGDTATNEVSIGADVTFDDDGPEAFRRGSGITRNEGSSDTTLEGQLQFDGGADGATVTGITFVSDGDYIRAIDTDASGPARQGILSAEGLPIVWSDTTDVNGVITVTGVLEGTTTEAFEIIVNPDGSYTYQQFVGFDHPDANEDGRADQLTFRMRFTVTDGDGDTDTATAVFRVRDSGPEIGVAEDGLVEEDGIRAIADADLAIDWGEDDANGENGSPVERSVDFAEPIAADTISFSDHNGSLDALYSGGELVNFTYINGVLVGYTGAAPGNTTDSNVVLIAVLSAEGTGSYDFLLVQPLDHTAPDGSEQFIDLSITYNATDSDDDTTDDGTFTVRIDAAGTLTPIDYSNLSSGVFVNLSDQEQTYLGQTVSAETATDRDGVDPAVIGLDSVAGLDDATGGTGNDILVGNDQANTLSGNDGDDLIVGGAGDDVAIGGGGDDTLVWNVGDGQDQVQGSTLGGTGDTETDTFVVNGDTTDETFYVETVADYNARLGGAAQTLDPNTEVVVSRAVGNGASTIVAQLDNIDHIDINGMGGADNLIVSGDFSGTDLDATAITFTGGDETDTVDTTGVSSDHRVVFNGNGGEDLLLAGIGINTFNGGAGIDTADYSATSEAVYVRLDQPWATVAANRSLGWTALTQGIADGTIAHDDLVDVESIIGTDFNDLIIGSDEANVIEGGDGRDFIGGLAGNDQLFGEDGNDRLAGGSGFDLLDGGEGVDVADYSGDSAGIFARMDQSWVTSIANRSLGWTALTQGIANNTIEHDDLVSIENLIGSNSLDIIVGDAGDNTIWGRGGDDLIAGAGGENALFGEAGNDRLIGGSGADKLAGGADQDTLTGGAGADGFVFAAGEGSALLSGADRVTDFQDGIDTIVITGGLTYADISVGDDGSGNATIFDNVNNQFVAVIEGVSSTDLDASDFSFGSDPIVLDLDGDGIELVSAAAGVGFDHNNDGEVEQSGWVGKDDGLLVADLDGSGAIENGTEVFSEIFNGGSYADSLEALASLDANSDGVIDKNDAAFDTIKVWQDANSDGVTQEGELQSLEALGIEAISLEAESVYRDEEGNSIYAEGSFSKADGSTGSYAGVSFSVASEDGQDVEETVRQSTAIAAGIALVLYSASSQEVEAGLSQIAVTGAPEHGEVSVSDDFTVTFTPAAGYEGGDSVELELVHADGSVVTRAVEIEVRADETTSSSEPVAAAEQTNTTVDNETQTESLAASADVAELGTLVTGSVIKGDDGDNILVGTDGDDVLIGGLGTDTLTGGGGADTFVLNSLAEADIITDYAFADGDKIDLGELLDGAFATAANAGEFVRAEKQADGAVRLEVDLDGQGTAHDWQDAATLQNHSSMGETIRVVLDVEGSEAQIPVNVA
ncbi:DUF5801 repeats-in-toxin domain-containing protein [Roseibium sp. HPY-6]|uniref:T1SS-143 repeat domain-containing protein n=1 Tax=Roseibium sp. HPY-6 TaxID=3229852 RepID=UPI00338E1B6B